MDIEKLREELKRHSYLYYVKDDPEITDYEYDMMMKKLIEEEERLGLPIPPDSPSVRVGGSAVSSFAKVEHEVPLLSLNDVFSFDELKEFDRHCISFAWYLRKVSCTTSSASSRFWQMLKAAENTRSPYRRKASSTDSLM